MSFMDPQSQFMLHINAPSGSDYETAMSEAMAVYCRNNKIPYHKMTNTVLDKHHGIDFLIGKDMSKDRNGLGFLRIDFTHNFKNKDNMPLLWETSISDKNLMVRNKPLQFGIRTDNKTSGFEEPVIVVGIQNDTESTNLQLADIRKELRKPEKINAILEQTCLAMSAYRYETQQAYQKYVNEKYATGEYEDLPETELLHPNYSGLESLHTAKRTTETIKGIRLAKRIAEEEIKDIEGFGNPEDLTFMKTFSNRCYGLLKGNWSRKKEPESWNKKVDSEYERLKELWKENQQQEENPNFS